MVEAIYRLPPEKNIGIITQLPPMEENNYVVYKDHGGTLTPEAFEVVLGSKHMEDENFPLRIHPALRRARIYQARFMAASAGVTLSSKEESWYVSLRDIHPQETESPANRLREEIRGLSDQEVFALMLLAAGRMTDYSSFTTEFPNIFQ